MVGKELLQLNRDPGTEILQLVGEEFLPQECLGHCPCLLVPALQGKIRKVTSASTKETKYQGEQELEIQIWQRKNKELQTSSYLVVTLMQASFDMICCESFSRLQKNVQSLLIDKNQYGHMYSNWRVEWLTRFAYTVLQSTNDVARITTNHMVFITVYIY